MVMKKETVFLVVIVVLVFSVAVLLIYQNLRASPIAITAPSTPLQNTRSQSAEESSAFATKTNNGEVSIDITPKGIQEGVAVFAIGVNTHTVDLSSFDLKKLTTLVINGEKFSPLSALELTGHHNQGELIFAVDSLPEKFTIVIQGIPDSQERVFSWG